jgi:pimeloyl-ACP methyl ester carboxylesterase
MPTVERPDGSRIHWEWQGEGPLVCIAHQLLWSYPQVYSDLIADLARDHRVVTYDPRGCGESTRAGPYDSKTDADDLAAVIETAGGGSVTIAVGYGCNLAARVAAERSELIETLITVAPAVAALLPRNELKQADVIASSDSVMEMILGMMKTDPRAAARTLLAATNPELTETELRERLDRVTAYISPEASLDRAQAWLEEDTSKQMQALGDRLWILHGEAEALFEGALATRVAELYPQAHIEEIADGPISQPGLTAAVLRRLS